MVAMIITAHLRGDAFTHPRVSMLMEWCQDLTGAAIVVPLILGGVRDVLGASCVIVFLSWSNLQPTSLVSLGFGAWGSLCVRSFELGGVIGGGPWEYFEADSPRALFSPVLYGRPSVLLELGFDGFHALCLSGGLLFMGASNLIFMWLLP
ncbi:hypothetical protein Dimus_003771 [Dionaea muscipula]